MYVMAINHDVTDYDQWKTVFDGFSPAKGGAVFHRLNRNVANPNNVTVVAGFESADAAREFAADPALKDAMKESGVVGAPRIEIFEEVEAIQY